MAKRSAAGDDSRFTTFGFETWKGHPPPMARPHRHNEIELNYLWAGQATYLVGGRLLRVPQRRLGVFWGAVPHHIVELDHACELSWVTLPLTWVLKWGLPAPFIERLLGGEWVFDQEEGKVDEALLTQWLADRNKKKRAWNEVVAFEIEARLRRLALQAAPSNGAWFIDAPEGAIAVVEEVARYVAQNYEKPLQTADIAEALNRHPNYLMQVFKKRCGVTIGEYVLHMRISHTQRLLTTTDRKIADIAMEAGFASLNRFYDAFGKVTGMPPGEYRKLHHNLSGRDRYVG